MRLLTVGLGSLRGESAAVGVDFASRGRRADEAIDVLRLLWAGDADGVSYQGEFFSIKHLRSFPKPYQATTLPIHVGGSSRAAARRAGRRGDGYFAGGLVPPDERAAQFGVMREAASSVGRDPAPLEYIRWGSLELDRDGIEARARQGITPARRRHGRDRPRPAACGAVGVRRANRADFWRLTRIDLVRRTLGSWGPRPHTRAGRLLVTRGRPCRSGYVAAGPSASDRRGGDLGMHVGLGSRCEPPTARKIITLLFDRACSAVADAARGDHPNRSAYRCDEQRLRNSTHRSRSAW